MTLKQNQEILICEIWRLICDIRHLTCDGKCSYLNLCFVPPSLTSHDFARASCNGAPARHSNVCLHAMTKFARMCMLHAQSTQAFCTSLGYLHQLSALSVALWPSRRLKLVQSHYRVPIRSLELPPLSAGLARTTWLARLTKGWGAIFCGKRNSSWILGDSPSTKSCSFSKQNESQRWGG